MIPYILAAVGGYLIADGCECGKKFSDGGVMQSDVVKINIEKDGSATKVYYVKGNIGFDGILRKYHTGRDYEYEFEPSYFNDKESESYYDKNWESIEEEILVKFYSNKKRK